jgi:hypothetical protein
MSYSFRKRAATRSALIALVVAELDNVVALQPIHSADRAQAQAAAESFLAIVQDPAEGKEFCIDMHGSMSYTWDGEKQEVSGITGGAVGVNVYHIQQDV